MMLVILATFLVVSLALNAGLILLIAVKTVDEEPLTAKKYRAIYRDQQNLLQQNNS